MNFGVDYYPEHWPKEQVRDDVRQMGELGLKVVRIGEFAWSVFEPREGMYDFSFFDYVLAELAKQDIKVIMGTPTATLPAWLYEKYPEVLSVDIDGSVREFGSRRQCCYNSLIYRYYSEKIVANMAEHYGNDERIIGWQVDNELGHEGSDRCYCENCLKSFREYLQNKYQTLDEFNEKMGTVFWNHTYSSWEQIPLPLKTIRKHNPGFELEYMRFASKSTISYLNFQVELLRQKISSNQFVTTNAAGTHFEQIIDWTEGSTQLDFIAYDNYPVWGGLAEPISPAELGLRLDIVRSHKNQKFWIVEQLIGAQGHDIIGYLPRPGQARLWTFQSIAHGASDILYFNWRACSFGIEEFCHGILDHDGIPKRKYFELQKIIGEQASLEKFSHASLLKSQAAILFDPENMWAWSLQPQSSAFQYKDEYLKFYRPLFQKNVDVDVVAYQDDFSSYRIVVIPLQMLVDKAFISRVKEYVQGGGTLIVGYRTGIKDRYNRIITKTIPGDLGDVLGIAINEYESLQTGQRVTIRGEKMGVTQQTLGRVWCDIIDTKTAETLAEYQDTFYEGKACVTVNSYGQGKAYYIGCSLEDTLMDTIYEQALSQAGIVCIETPERVEVRKSGGLFLVMNHNGHGVEVVLGTRVVPIEAYGVQFIKE